MFNTTHKKNSLNFGGYLFLTISVYFIYYLLIKDNLLHFSIVPILQWTSQNSKQLHVLAIALVPVYLALMIFGAAMLSTVLGSKIQHWLMSRFKA